LDSLFSPEFQEIIDMCRREIKKPSKESGVKSNWARLMLDSVKAAQEEMRRDAGKFIVYHVVHEDPLKPLDEVPPLPELPPPSEAAG
jgi:hypothetical protein